MGQPQDSRGLRPRGNRYCLFISSFFQLKCKNQADDFVLGSCGFRWAALLAVIAFVDSIVLGGFSLLTMTRLFWSFALIASKLELPDDPKDLKVDFDCLQAALP